jgi:hypothetical protein
MFVPDPGSDFYPSGSQIQQQHQKRRWKTFWGPTIFCSNKYHKIVNNFIFEQVKKIILAKTLRIVVLVTQKFVIKLSKIWVWDPGSEIRDPEKTYSGSKVKKASDLGSATLPHIVT